MSLSDVALVAFCNLYNQINKLRSSPLPQSANCEELRQIQQRATSRPTDICDHLVTLFAEAVSAHPRLIVELGVRSGESTFAFERAAGLSDAHLISVDIEPCSLRCSYAKWAFVRQDDVSFANEFPAWCLSRGVAPEIDVLFIDTSHSYDHTIRELRTWLPHLSARAKLILHDTNMRRLYRRADGSLGVGWDNARGVIRALEEQLDVRFNEQRDFVTVANGWTIRHWAHCNGLTVLERL